MTEKRAAGSVGQTDPAAAETLDGDIINNSTHSKVKNFLEEEETSNADCEKYEPFNVLNENGDSIYAPNSSEVEQKGQFYFSVDILLEELSDQIKSLQKSQALLRKDLVSAGVLKAA